MKKLLVVFLAFGSFSTFAFEESEFERGYSAGKESCEVAKEAWICTIPKTVECISSSAYRGIGKSRSEAVLNIYDGCLQTATEANVKPVCTKL